MSTLQGMYMTGGMRTHHGKGVQTTAHMPQVVMTAAALSKHPSLLSHLLALIVAPTYLHHGSSALLHVASVTCHQQVLHDMEL